MNKTKAFTLSEVLITLAIIGIVAAMTIPTLINKAQNAGLETGFKKAYSNLANVSKEAVDELGSPITLDSDKDTWLGQYTDSDSFYPKRDAIMSKYSIVSGPGHGVDMYNYEWTKNFDKTMSTHSDYNNNNSSLWYLLKDGSTMGFYPCGGGGFGCMRIMLDTNGLKSPNRLGYDTFTFTISKGKLVPIGYLDSPSNPQDGWQLCAPVSKGGSASSYNNGGSCTYWALKNVCPWDNTKSYWECLP